MGSLFGYRRKGLVAIGFAILSAVSLTPNVGHSQEYCVAVRGNGELAPAHWSALSKMVEELGMPRAMAGGSSASISMFFMESIGGSRLLTGTQDAKLEQALMLKSILPYLKLAFHQSKSAIDLAQLVLLAQSQQSRTVLERLAKEIQNAKTQREVVRVIRELGPLLNRKYIEGLAGSNSDFYQKQLSEAISVFGKFDAVNDRNLFFREGLVDFAALGVYLGQVADFFAGNGDESTNSLLKNYLRACSQSAKGKLWSELSRECQGQLKAAFTHYISRASFPNVSINSLVGTHLQSVPTTAVIAGASAKNYLTMKNQFTSLEGADIQAFKVDFNRDLRFGYWGTPRTLNTISEQLPLQFGDDLKSSKFLKLGRATWLEVISKSPAEPGLASLLPFKVQGRDGEVILSAGGWSDLHPIPVLKALGCENTIYLTRQGGESVFGQQIFIRLVGDTDKIDFWTRLKENNDTGWAVNSAQSETPWNQLYNFANPKSSYRRSINEADAVYCTNWNIFDAAKGEVDPLVADAYSSPVIIRNGSHTNLQLNPQRTQPKAGCGFD